MKNKLYFLLLMALMASLSGITAQTIDSCFINMPLEQLPTLPVNSRKDLVDFYKNGRIAVMPESLGGEMTLKILSKDYIKIQTSTQTSFQIKILPINDSTSILAVIHSASAPLKDSRLQFFTTGWKPIQNIDMQALTCLDFLDTEKAGKELSDRFSGLCMRNFIYLEFQPDNTMLNASSSIKEDLPKELLEDFLPYLKDSVALTWLDGRFEL